MDFPDKFQSYFQLDKLHQINISFVVNKLEVQIGGIASNISYGLSLLTKKKVVVLGAVGKDGQKILKFYKKHGIETENIISDKKDFTSLYA
ncbi:MAG: carbohydrate kinase family protein, partial [Cyanobacteria bacterium]|nr:carbohydrate kinase family protein [Cyanobacteriota bacterium]